MIYNVIYFKYDHDRLNEEGFGSNYGKKILEWQHPLRITNAEERNQKADALLKENFFQCLGSYNAKSIEHVYSDMQNISENHLNPFEERSMSIGDIVIDGKDAYTVNNIGWTKLNEDISKKMAKLCEGK